MLKSHFGMGVFLLITWLSEICLTSSRAFFWNFPLIICNSPLPFSHSKNIRMSILITIIPIIITYYYYYYYHYYYYYYYYYYNYYYYYFNDYKKVTIIIVCSLRACHMWLTRNHMFIHEIWGINLPCSFFEILKSKFQKSELCKFIPNFTLNLRDQWRNHCIAFS